MISDNNRDEDALYLLDKKNKTLEKQSFYIMNNDIYQDRFIIVNRDSNNNFVKGLVDIKTHQIVLPIKYDYIEISEHFYLTDQYDRNKDQHYREIYTIKNHQKIYSGHAHIIIDKENFITKSGVCSKEESDDYDYSSYSPKQGTQYCYAQYDLYDIKGKKLNTKAYRDITDNFSNNNLLLVSSNKQQFFVNRQAQKLNIDLTSYQKVSAFSQGLAAVKCNSNEQYGYIDIKGNRIIPCIYEGANYCAMVEYHGTYQLIRPDNSVIKTFENRLYSYTNEQDNIDPSYTFDDSTKYNSKGEIIAE